MSKHPIPGWLRSQFSRIEDEVQKLGPCGVFTQMRTVTQTYFEQQAAEREPPALDDDMERGMDLGMFLAEMKNVKAERDQLKAEAEQLSETSMSQESMIEQLTARCDELEREKRSMHRELHALVPEGYTNPDAPDFGAALAKPAGSEQ
ncbi:hypothetical protein I9H06_16620 [Pseudomonas tremae]|uniref:hypothetical protein n=1 Tax=Pseudomonas tremae TaxID=200454 RepID=UPI001F2DBC9B|nr:hypothetical protein [Pseudomonas tremae]MCF5714279.1 hypothetical protein [Pseudomonas tremae]UQB34442.1 hypothetical protein I9H06_16620 [Pseudomonas tremae]